MKNKLQTKTDIVLIGSGIMSATLGILLKKLMPEKNLILFEQADRIAPESSDAWNNAGTGHSSFCELNYTPEQADGSIKMEKALQIASAFEVSKQFWAYLKDEGILKGDIINKVPHMSFVLGEENISFLKRRHQAMTEHALFEDMEYSEDFDEIANWAPIMMEGRDRSERFAVTKMDAGTDVNFGVITRSIIEYLKSCDGVEVYLNHQVKDFMKKRGNGWEITVKDLEQKQTNNYEAEFVFIGAGGGVLPLLQKSGIKESKGYGGFPVSGMFLHCDNPDVIKKHETKVYGKAAEGSPPMSMPHLDRRVIDGKESILFGPYAGISSKFLKKGSTLDLFKSIRLHNIWPMLMVARHNLNLIKYLVNQAKQSPKSRFKTLQKYYPQAKMEDWKLIVAGQRVQIMKKDEEKGGVLKLGTEIIHSEDGTLAALLGASPGASTSVSIMLEVLSKCFGEMANSKDWESKLKEMIPSYGDSLIKNGDLCREIRNRTDQVLNLKNEVMEPVS